MTRGDSGTALGPLPLFCARLTRLQQAAGATQTSLARAAHLSTSQMSDILNGKIKKPPEWHVIAAMVRACLEYAAGAARQVPPDLGDEADWRRRHTDLEHDLEAGVRLPRESAGWALAQVTDPFALEVHRPVQLDRPQPDLPALTPYVAREHDRELERAVTAAARGSTGIAVLVGGSSTGKTRACWEALRRLRERPERWRLWHPIDPSRPEAALRELGSIGRRTVVWLNDAQFYLDAPSSELGEKIAAGLRELLRDPARAPVLVLATLWPQYWDALTAQPPGGQPDPHAQARELLAGHDISVPGAFTPAQVEELTRTADPRPRC
jgi:transcriptional regulator with XRE-family HTH domain